MGMIEEKARTVLTKSEHSRFTFYRLEVQYINIKLHFTLLHKYYKVNHFSTFHSTNKVSFPFRPSFAFC